MIRRLFKERGNPLFRWLDRYIGIPIVFMLGLTKRKKIVPKFSTNQPLRIAILLTSGIGDTVLFSGVIQDLQLHFPKATITLFSGSSNYEMARLLPVKVVKLPITKPLKAFSLILKENHFDLWFDGNPWPRLNALFTFFAKASFKIGFHTKHQYRHYVYDCAATHRTTCHEMDNYRSLITPFIHAPQAKPYLCIHHKNSNIKQCALHLFPGGSRSYLKEWPEEYWLELITHLTHQGYACHFTGGKADFERLEKIKDRYALSVKNSAGLSLKETAQLLKTCNFVVSVDTGIMHLAAALGCKVISLHGPTSFYRWGAIGAHVYPITPQKTYTPCIHLGFESCCKNNSCMKEISVKRILEKIKAIEVKASITHEPIQVKYR